MSYVKAGIIYDGKMEIYEVHGSELVMSTKKKILSEMEQTAEWYRGNPELIKKRLEHYKKCLKSPQKYNNSIVQDKVKLGISELNTPKQLKKWVEYLKRMNIPSKADRNLGYPYNCIVDIDNKTFLSMKDNWYAAYGSYLPDGWVYRELSINEMKEMDRAYRGGLEGGKNSSK